MECATKLLQSVSVIWKGGYVSGLVQHDDRVATQNKQTGLIEGRPTRRRSSFVCPAEDQHSGTGM